jgi:hypothetical protein
MDTKLGALALVVVLLLAGCSGVNEAATDSPDGTETVTPTPELTDEVTPTQTAITGQHPAITDGTFDVSTLVRGHLTALRGAESFTLLNNRTVTFVENGSVFGRGVLINKADVANQRLRLESRFFTPDGDIQNEQIRFSNATTTCTLRSGEYECSDDGVSTERIIGFTMETTSLETIGAPDFKSDGIAEREGQSLYRYSASAFRTSMDSNTEGELYGPDPTLEEATLLVDPNGRIVEYSLTYRTGGENPQELTLTYVTTAINTTTLEPLDPPE